MANKLGMPSNGNTRVMTAREVKVIGLRGQWMITGGSDVLKKPDYMQYKTHTLDPDQKKALDAYWSKSDYVWGNSRATKK